MSVLLESEQAKMWRPSIAAALMRMRRSPRPLFRISHTNYWTTEYGIWSTSKPTLKDMEAHALIEGAKDERRLTVKGILEADRLIAEWSIPNAYELAYYRAYGRDVRIGARLPRTRRKGGEQ